MLSIRPSRHLVELCVVANFVEVFLAREGHEVVGLFMKTGVDLPAGETTGRRCCSLDDAWDAARVADLLGIRFYALNYKDRFLRVLEEGQADDLILTLEGDGTSDLAILPRMLRRAREEGDQLVLASCYLYGGGIRGTQMHRVGLSHIANGLMKKALGLSGLSTLSSFYRLYTLQALRRMHERWGEGFIRSRGFECQVEILYRAAQLRLPISEVPMVLDNSRRVGGSKMRILRTSLAYLRLSALALTGGL